MEPWSFSRAVSFCLAHAKQRVTLRQRGSTLRLTGTLAALDERDACSMDLVEAELDLGMAGLHCTVTLHETTLLIHLSGETGNAGLFLPVSIPYAELVLTAADAMQAAPPPDSPSPYELL
jgi:hypothetical protein